jgi:hypothetical protein
MIGLFSRADREEQLDPDTAQTCSMRCEPCVCAPLARPHHSV